MIQFENWTISAPRGEVIARQYDNLSRTLTVMGDLPAGWDWSMLVDYGDKPTNVIALSPVEGGIGATLTADMIPYAGYYRMQLRGTQGEAVRHTNIIRVYIPESLTGEGQWPDLPSEFEQIEERMQELAGQAQDSADAADTSAKAAAESAAAAQGAEESVAANAKAAQDAANAAQTSAGNAKTSETNAAKSAGDAQTSAGNAKTSETNAAKSAGDAQTSAGQAADSATQAKTAQGKAEAAQTAAEKAQGQAEAQATAAAGSATAAQESAVAAAGSSSSASGSAQTAQTAAQNAQTAAQNAQEARQGAQAAQQAIEDLEVSSETLEPDSPASVEKTVSPEGVVTLEFGIPRGPQGQPGADAPQINDAIITDANPWSAKKIVDTLAPEFETSGAVVTCTPVAGYPLHVVSQIMPVQEGEGDPSPENVRPIAGWAEVTLRVCGKNLVQIIERTEELSTGLIIDWHSDGRVTISGSPTEPTGYSLNTKDSLVLPAGSYYISQNPPSKDWFRFWYRGSYYMGRALEANGINPILMAVRNVPAGDIPAETAYPMITVGSTPPDQYEPPNPNEFTITLPLGQTVYGGTLDWQTGVLTVTHGEIASYAGESLPGVWMSDRDVYSAGSTPTTGAQVVYELAIPQTIQLTPQEVLALAGTNTIYTNTGDITVSGRADPNTIIQSLSQRIAALEEQAING